MAENNLARSRNDVPDFFADGDPLAELARIVGYEDRVVANPEPVAAEPVAAKRTDPVFNLEDELLREFERYDAPRLDPADDLDVSVPSMPAFDDASAEPVLDARPLFTPGFEEPAGEDEHREENHPLEQWTVRDASYEAPASAPENDFVDHRLDDAAFHASVEDELSAFALETDAEKVAEVLADPVDQVPSPLVATAAEPDVSFDDFDLAAELETSIAAEPLVPVQSGHSEAQPSVADAKRKGVGYTPSFRMPLANFQSGAGVASHQRVETKEEQQIAPTKIEPVSFDGWNVSAPVSSVAAVSVAAPVVAAMPMPQMDIPLAGPAESIAANVSPASAESGVRVEKNQFSELDELLYGVDRYSARPQLDVPAFAAVQSDVAADIAPMPAQDNLNVAPAPQVAAPVASVAPVTSLDDSADPFADLDFELALDDLELDLTDMVVEENNKVAAPVVVASRPAVSVAPVMAPAPPAPVISQAVEAPIAAPVYAAAFNAQAAFDSQRPGDAEPEDDVPFDPALIAESEEQPEVIAELDVPVLPIEEKEEQPVYRNDFDLDIDAELASLLEAPETVPSIQRGSAAQQPAAAPAAQKSVYADLDDFERALEEDFRRSLATPLPANERYAAAEDYEQNVDEEQARAPVRRWIAPLAAVGVLAICGAGAYAWFGSSATGLAGNGEPVVIAADSEPVKVAPANPGGKTVPNQDKAVYDRVAGAGSGAPKQQQLISSSEEPVDVVQKTLMPDTLPLEGENDVQMTDVADTEDPRLLPQDQQQAAEQQPVTVMPRKVKTMIVRADGKLVEQEIEPAAAEKIAAAPVRTDAPAQTAAAFPTSAPASAAPSTGLVPVSAPAGAASAVPVTAQAPAAIEQLADTAPAERAPVPATRPSAPPANVVASVSGQGNVRPAAAPAATSASPAAPAAQNTQVASLGNGGYVIQIASLPSEADAQRSYQSLSGKFGSVIGGRGVDIKSAEIAGKGTFYRVRIPAGSKDQAVELCEKYRAAGGSCLVAR
ncbi:SPOR domain-containing protein [Aliirhizobium smilacinae]|uniref:SPOR domain-containing protein n=1 Tax=Aliirhizobium smilacinae TaxID=1395944 RepID=A0A5C4XP73_9HYPH|nr:SPOR domain-containing protein [Rhizobium smilacinae]TNM65029.1 SPOR domain-containing protein [Rhizobium smilacinae]